MAVSVESDTAVENVKVRGDDGIELRHIVGGGGGKDRAHGIDDLLLLGSGIHISGE